MQAYAKFGLLCLIELSSSICLSRMCFPFGFILTVLNLDLFQVDKWWGILLPMVAPFLYRNGGPIIMVQVCKIYSCGCFSISVVFGYSVDIEPIDNSRK